jgi:hypothetical protein
MANVLSMQRSNGNAAVARMLGRGKVLGFDELSTSPDVSEPASALHSDSASSVAARRRQGGGRVQGSRT